MDKMKNTKREQPQEQYCLVEQQQYRNIVVTLYMKGYSAVELLSWI